jgi:hypothetical protein
MTPSEVVKLIAEGKESEFGEEKLKAIISLLPKEDEVCGII